MLLIRFEALPSVRIAVLFLLSVLRTLQAEKSHGKPCAYRGK